MDIEAVLPIPEADDIARCAFPPPTTSLMPPSARTTGWKVLPALDPAGGYLQGPGIRLGIPRLFGRGGLGCPKLRT